VAHLSDGWFFFTPPAGSRMVQKNEPGSLGADVGIAIGVDSDVDSNPDMCQPVSIVGNLLAQKVKASFPKVGFSPQPNIKLSICVNLLNLRTNCSRC
jgi:hypothetical protein